MLTHARNRRGVALPLSIFALVIVGALVAGAFFIGMQENTVGKNTVSLQQAFQAAEAGADLQVANWDPTAYNGMAVGGVASFNGTLANNTGWYRGDVTRLNDLLYLVRSEGFSGNSETRQQVGRLLRLRPVQIELPGALSTQGPVRVGGSSEIDGYDNTPGGWTDCPPLDGPLPGIVMPDTSQLTRSGCTNWSCVSGDPQIEEDPTVTTETLSTFGDLTFAELENMATVRLAGGNLRIEPTLRADNTCNRDDVENWGDPLNPSAPCGSYFPIIWVEGDAHVNGVQGQGILLVNGDLRVDGNFEFYGPVIVNGALITQGTGGHFQGGVIAANADLEDTEVLGNAVVEYSSCAIARALQNTAPASLLRDRSWVNLY